MWQTTFHWTDSLALVSCEDSPSKKTDLLRCACINKAHVYETMILGGHLPVATKMYRRLMSKLHVTSTEDKDISEVHPVHMLYLQQPFIQTVWPNIVGAPMHAHLPLHVLHKALGKMQSWMETLRMANKALPKICVGPHWMLLLLSAGPFSSRPPCCTRSMRFGLAVRPPWRYRPLLSGAERRGCVVYHILAGPFFSHPHLNWRRSQRERRADSSEAPRRLVGLQGSRVKDQAGKWVLIVKLVIRSIKSKKWNCCLWEKGRTGLPVPRVKSHRPADWSWMYSSSLLGQLSCYQENLAAHNAEDLTELWINLGSLQSQTVIVPQPLEWFELS